MEHTTDELVKQLLRESQYIRTELAAVRKENAELKEQLQQSINLGIMNCPLLSNEERQIALTDYQVARQRKQQHEENVRAFH